MVFRLYGVEAGGEALWAENHSGVTVANGLFSVLLGGSTSNPNPIPLSLFAENDSLWLGISVGGDQEMTPREQLASAPSAMTVPDGSITTAKIADGAVTPGQLNLNADVDLQGHKLSNAHGLEYIGAPHDSLFLRSLGDGDDIRLISDKGITFFIDANHNSENASFRIERNSGHWGGAVSEVFKIQRFPK